MVPVVVLKDVFDGLVAISRWMHGQPNVRQPLHQVLIGGATKNTEKGSETVNFSSDAETHVVTSRCHGNVSERITVEIRWSNISALLHYKLIII